MENIRPIESEIYFMLHCPAYQTHRETWLRQLSAPINFSDLSDQEKLKIALNNPENVKITANFLISALNVRSTRVNALPS